MTHLAPAPLPPPTMVERAAAARAARALKAAVADPSTMGERSVVHIDLSRPRRDGRMTPNRRTFLAAFGVTLAAPAVICTPGLLMPVRPMQRGFADASNEILRQIASSLDIPYADLTRDWIEVARQVERKRRRAVHLCLAGPGWA